MKLSYKILIPIALFVLVIGSLVVVIAYQILYRTLLQEKFLEITENVQGASSSFISEKTLRSPRDAVSEYEFSEFVSATQSSAIARITIWDEKSILFSDLKQLQGQQSETPTEVLRALRDGTAHFVIRNKDTNMPKQTDVRDFMDIFVPIRSSDGSVSAVVEVYAASEVVLRAMRQNTTSISLLFLFAGAMILLTIYIVLRWSVLQNILRLTTATKTIASGNFDTHLLSSSSDEIGQLTRYFDTMRHKIKGLTEHMEEEVRYRTEAWREEEARLAASVQSISFGFVIVDTNHRVLLHNSAVRSILNISGEHLGEDLLARIFATHFDFRAYGTECMENKKALQIQSIPLEKKFVRVIFTPVVVTSESESKVIGYVVLIEDITEAKLIERTKDEFFAVASHELRTPLTVIRGNMSMLKDLPANKLDADSQGMINDSYEASKHLIAIVNDFLDTSRLEQGRVILRREPIDLSLLTEEVLSELGAVSSAKGIPVVYRKSSESLPSVMADRERVKQVIYNLVGNAISYTNKGSVAVEIVREGGVLRMIVRDSGIGISAQNQKLLFKKFQQAGENMLTRDVTRGTGLGLYISKLLVSTMGGEIGLEYSELGKGSAFFFTLPLAGA